MKFQRRVQLLTLGVILYELVQWNFGFLGNAVLEAWGIYLILIALLPA